MDIIKLNALIPVINRIMINSGNIALRFSKDRFVYKNWLDNTREPWEKRKQKDRGSLLVRTGTLKRSIRIISRIHNRIIIGSDVPYARIHNEGGTISGTQNVRSHNRTRRGRTHRVSSFSRKSNTKIPKRTFLDHSRFLEKKIERMMEIEITHALNKL